MIEAGGNINWNHELEHACTKGYREIALLAIEHGATLFHINNGLSNACGEGYLDIALLMIEKGATSWDNSLSLACHYDHLKLVLLMIEKRSNCMGSGIISGVSGRSYEYCIINDRKRSN